MIINDNHDSCRWFKPNLALTRARVDDMDGGPFWDISDEALSRCPGQIQQNNMMNIDELPILQRI